METEMGFGKDLLPYPFGSPRDILTAFFRQKLKILAVFIAILLPSAAWIYSQATFYEAHATIILKLGKEHKYSDPTGDSRPIVRFDESSAVESERKILESPDLARRTVQAIGVENLYPELIGPSGKVGRRQIDIAATKLLGSLESTTTKGTNVLDIVFFHQVPKVAANALNVLINELKEKHLQIFSDPNTSFLVQQLDQYQKDLEEAESTLQSFKQKNDLASPLEDQQRRLLDQRAHLDTNSKTISNEIQGLVGKIASIESQMEAVPENIPLSTTERGGDLAKAKADLFSLKRQKHGLLGKYTETSAPVQNVQREIELLENFIRTETNDDRDRSITTGKNPIFRGLETSRLTALSELKTLQARNRVITSQILDLDGKIQRLDTLSEQFFRFDKMKNTAEENYKLYVKKVEESKVSEEMDKLKMSNISVIQSADVPRVPSGRPKKIKFIFGAIVAAITSLALGFVFEYLQGGYTRPDQAAEDLGVPILASFSHKY